MSQDYESALSESWKIYATAFEIIGEEPNEAFKWVFKRAYALGKEKETITQEEIEEAAEDYVSFEKGGKCYPSYIVERACCCAFKDGANFAIGKQKKKAENKTALTDKEVYALESAISELESLMDGTLDEDYHKGQKSIINALKRIIKKYEKR